MVKIYGGLWFENLVAQDPFFDLQMLLHQGGLTKGIQLRVAHPYFTPQVDVEMLPRIFSALPEDLEVFIHFGAENRGVDFGQNFDELDVYANRGRAAGISWDDWNRQTLEWGLEVAETANIPSGYPLGVVHPGYGKSILDGEAREQVIKTFQTSLNGLMVALENVPPFVDGTLYRKATGRKISWPYECFWGFGGTPQDMTRLLAKLGRQWRCLLDFTHLVVMVNQANHFPTMPPLRVCRKLEKVVEAYLKLPHWPICHFSGTPPPDTLADSHDHIESCALPPIREALRQMEVICLEIPFRPATAQRLIEGFREQCQLY